MLYQQAQSGQQRALSLVAELEQALAGAGYRPGTVDGEHLRKSWAYRELVTERLGQARDELALAEQYTERARAQLIHARQQRKIFETLRDKHEARERLALARREQALLDEAGSRMRRAAARAETEVQVRR